MLTRGDKGFGLAAATLADAPAALACLRHPPGARGLVAVILLKRKADNPTVLAHLTLDQFMERLLIGEAPATTWC